VLAFADSLAAASVTGRGWLAEALATWEIEVVVVDLEDNVRTGLNAAQVRQRMVNSAAPAEGPESAP
jgi:hypothetical protein